MRWWLGVLVGLGVVPQLGAQALDISTLDNGTTLLQLAQPFADVTAVAWVETDEAGRPHISTRLGGGISFGTELEQTLGDVQHPPPVVVVVGGAVGSDTRRLVNDLVGATRPAELNPPTPQLQVEGGVEKRLGTPGDQAVLQVSIPLPPASSWLRSSALVLLEALPAVLAKEHPGLLVRNERGVGVLELRIDPELAQLQLDRLRLSLAQLSSEPRLVGDEVARATVRLGVRRHAELSQYPDVARQLAELWLDGGSAAVREHVFGFAGVTPETVRQAALEWLPHHPGAAVIVLPPRVFNPRFAVPPIREHLGNDLTIAVLERPSTSLASMCLRPVLLPDLDGELSATVLARLAAEVRATEDAPGWVRVTVHPTQLELAGPAEGIPELCESLRAALHLLAQDQRDILESGGDARRRSLRLMASHLGLSAAEGLTPASLLRPGNLALGMVAPDGEATLEAVHKLLVDEMEPMQAPQTESLEVTQRTREAAPGQRSALALLLELGIAPDDIRLGIVAALLRQRAAALFDEEEVEVVIPFVPGRAVLLMVCEASMVLPELEQRVQQQMPRLLAPVSEPELSTTAHQVAAAVSAASSGPLGRARMCAAIASGAASWQAPAQVEMATLTLSVEELNEVLSSLGPWESLLVTGAGRMPLDALDEPDDTPSGR